jgi:hypothetical protein
MEDRKKSKSPLLGDRFEKWIKKESFKIFTGEIFANQCICSHFTSHVFCQ